MPLFPLTPAQKFTPKTIRFSKLYGFNTGGGKFGGSLVDRASDGLRRAGFSDSKIREIIYNDKAIPTAEMKRVAEVMNQARIYGFEKAPEFAIKAYLNKERVKAQSIARIRKEHILEAGQEDLAASGITSLNPKGVSPNAPQAGESSILARQRRHHAAASTLSGKTGSPPVSSLKARRTAGSLSPLSAAGNGKKSGLTFKPKF